MSAVASDAEAMSTLDRLDEPDPDALEEEVTPVDDEE
jgi:hypothetical protein